MIQKIFIPIQPETPSCLCETGLAYHTATTMVRLAEGSTDVYPQLIGLLYGNNAS